MAHLKLAPIIDPALRKPAPKPVRVDLRIVFAGGTGLWAIALVVCIALQFLGFATGAGVTMCACGVIIGILMLIWEHFDRWDYRRLGM